MYAWLGLRPFLAQHTAAEHAALQRWALGRTTLAEIGVAEGVSALALREAMSPDGTLYLIDPFHSKPFASPEFHQASRAQDRVNLPARQSDMD